MPRFAEGILDHQQAEHGPENDVVHLNQQGPADPEPLDEMQEPRHQKRERRRKHKSPRLTKLPEAEIGGVVEDLQHEVLPIDVDPPPEVREARCQEIPMMRLREVESKQVKHANHDVEIP